MLQSLAVIVLVLAVLVLLAAVGVSINIYISYLPKLARIFEEQPFFVTEEGSPVHEAESVSFRTEDGLTLEGSYWATTAPRRRGVILFCHEFLSNRWSGVQYCEPLREAGFDILTFDFRNHGTSDALRGYEPLQWVTDYEVADVLAALRFIRQRFAGSPVQVGMFGISRGGSAALCAAAASPQVRAIATDGAFPTNGTQVHYIYRWACIYSPVHRLFAHFPRWYVRGMAWMTCYQVGRRRGCRFTSIERAMTRLAGRPLLMIHGQRDNYIVPEIVQELLRFTRSQAQLWIVPKAKHNQCLETQPEQYRNRIVEFFCRHLDEREPRETQEAA